MFGDAQCGGVNALRTEGRADRNLHPVSAVRAQQARHVGAWKNTNKSIIVRGADLGQKTFSSSVFVSHPMTNATFPRKNGETPKWVVDFLRERETPRKQITEIVEDFACQATNLRNLLEVSIFDFSSFLHIYIIYMFSFFHFFHSFSFFPFSLFFLNFSFFHFSCFFFFFCGDS